MKTLPKRLIKSFLTLLLIVSSVLLLPGCESTLFDKNYKYRDYYVRVGGDMYNNKIIGRENEIIVLYAKEKLLERENKLEKIENERNYYVYIITEDMTNQYIKVAKKVKYFYDNGGGWYMKVSDITAISLDKYFEIEFRN